MAPPLSSGPPTSNVGPRYAPPSSSGQLMAGTSGPQFGAPLVNGPSGSMPPPPTSQYGGHPPLNGGHLSGPQSFSVNTFHSVSQKLCQGISFLFKVDMIFEKYS